ncbi:MAG: SPOR domain-containing protein [Deltaproteobacteria bacterium]|nr:SPOR domain-containing protein [Deltaproteobacteria bacterium]
MADNRKEKNGRFYFTKGQMVLLGTAFILASFIVFTLGMFVGKEIEARKLVRPEEPLVKVPVNPSPQADAGAEGQKGKNNLTFYNTLTKTPPSKPPAETKAVEKETEKPRATLEPETKSDTAATTPAKKGDKTWSVQANSYPDEQSANELVDRLKNKGYNAFVTQANIKGKTWYRVRVGRVGSREEAEKIEAALKNKENLDNAFATQR